MLTPVKLFQSKRVHTTANTDYYLSTHTLVDLNNDREELSFVYPELNGLRKKLFVDRVEAVKEIEGQRDGEKVSRNYRKEMMRYLDDKFVGKGGTGAIKQRTRPSQTNRYTMKPQAVKIDFFQVEAVFKQYMDIVRENRIKKMTEYNVGVILLKLGFIKSMLDERCLIDKVWKILKEPNHVQLFVFIAFTYFHGKERSISKDKATKNKQSLCKDVEQLFKEEGYPFDVRFISRAYDDSASSGLNLPARLKLLNNRQQRPTCNSLSRQNSLKRT